jgi:hypothetical protein
MKVSTWKNGKLLKSGAGYGIRILSVDIDEYFTNFRNKTIIVEIDLQDSFEYMLRNTFWTTCPEIRSKKNW